MAQNVIIGLFEVESEAYQALTELKQAPGNKESYLSAAALVKKENGALSILDAFDTGANTANDAAIGGLIGALFGVLGGPIGVLLGGSYGMLVSSAIDAGDALLNASMLEQIAAKLQDKDIAIIGLAFEEDEAILDEKLSKFQTMIIRYDAAAVEDEVDEALKIEAEMARQTHEKLRGEIKEERKERREAKRARMLAEWEEFKANYNPEDNID